jgi:hypothetical protein
MKPTKNTLEEISAANRDIATNFTMPTEEVVA